MKNVIILNRAISTAEMERINIGFNELMIEEGLDLESSEQISFVAIEDNIFIGGVSGHAYKNGDNYSGWFYITDLFVEKAYRSKGLGSQLIIALENQLKSKEIKNIWLWTSGDKAIQFYERQRYKIFTEMNNWYSDGSSRVGLLKQL